MKKSSAVIMAFAALACGCTMEIHPDAPMAEKTVFTVSAPSTRTVIGDASSGSRQLYWADGDCLAVNGTVSEALSGVPAESTNASFTVNGTLTAPYDAVYPASIWKDASTVTLPATVQNGVLPLGGRSNDPDLALSPLTSCLHLVLKQSSDASPDTHQIAYVEISTESVRMNGDFTIDYENAGLTPAASASADECKVRVAGPWDLPASGTLDLFVPVPAGTYSFSVKILDVKGHFMTVSTTGSKNMDKGVIKAFPAIEFKPTGTQFDVVITSASDLVTFAQEYNAKAYESLGSDLKVGLEQDITFDATTSAAFNAAGGIGTSSDANRFSGVFEGKNHIVSGLESTVPLFNGTSSSGTIKDLILDDSCSFTFTHPDSGNYEVGSVVGYHRGTLDNVSVAANVSLADADVTNVTALGGLVGRIVVGTIDNSAYSGAISTPAGFTATDSFIYIGGLAGHISNASGIIQNSYFEGTLENEGKLVATSESDDMKNYPHLIMGGIVGLNSGTVSNCETANHATGITETLTDDKGDHDYTGTIITHSTNAYHYALAGIAGRNDGTVENCTNNADILNIFSAVRGSGGNMNGRYLEVGGIAGYNAPAAKITGCGNNASNIIDRANPKIHYVGGIVGRNYGTVSGSDNNCAIGLGTSHTSPYGARMPYVGGVVGSNENGATLNAVDNNGNINVSRIETTTGFICRIGGIAGYSNAPIDGASGGGSITNMGNVAQSTGIGHCSTPEGANDYGYHIGGIVGYATKAVENVTNEGKVSFTCNATGVGAQYVRLGGVIGKLDTSSKVDVEKCTNSGNVSYTASATYSANNATRYYYNYMGGIVGYAKNVGFTNCYNSGIIKGGDGSSNNNNNGDSIIPSFVVGGIVGYITGDSSIEYCDLVGNGNAYNDHWSNRGIGRYDCPIVGGIAGNVAGADGATIPVSNCNIASTASVNARRGAIGGIVGIAQYSSISSCEMPVLFQTSQSGYFYGGIAALANNTTISNCVFSATTIRSSQIQIGGGIVGQLEAGSTIDGCSSYATDISKNGTAVATTGGIAGKSVAGSTIKNSHYTTTIGKICGDANFTDGGGNLSDL